jgi:outer membrane protein OmpA-like peptidoglycan-associated protein
MPSEISYKVDANSQLSTNAVKFLKGSIELADQASYQYLVNLSAALQAPELAPFRFVVEGHASAEGADYANFLLSQRRANAIFGFLTSRGVSPQRLLAVGHGETYARFGEQEPDYLRAEDRQVVVFKLAE